MTLISKIYNRLLSNKTSLPKYICFAFLIEFLPTICFAIIVFSIIYIFDLPFRKLPERHFGWEFFWGGVVIAPILETYLLILTLHILRSFGLRDLKLSILTAIIWGLVHGVQSWPRFFPTAWAFFMFSTAYETWRLDSFKKAFTAAALMHAMNNGLIMFSMLLDI